MSTPRNPDGEGGESWSEDEPYPGPSQESTPGLSEEYADVFDCRALEVSCHITKWFHSLVVSILEPLFGWIATRMFATPAPTEGIANIWHGTLLTVNILYALLVLAVAFVVMAHHSLQAQYGAKELLPRLVFGWVAANVSLTVVSLAASVSTAISEGIVSSGINSRTAAQNLRENASRFLEQEAVAVDLFLVVFIILFVVWLVVEIIRIVIVILLMVAFERNFLLIFVAIGAMAALEYRHREDMAAWTAEQDRKVRMILGRLKDIPGLALQVDPDPSGCPFSRVRLTPDPKVTGHTAASLEAALLDGNPTVVPRAHHTDEGYIHLDAIDLTDAELRYACEKVRMILTRAS